MKAILMRALRVAVSAGISAFIANSLPQLQTTLTDKVPAVVVLTPVLSAFGKAIRDILKANYPKVASWILL